MARQPAADLERTATAVGSVVGVSSVQLLRAVTLLTTTQFAPVSTLLPWFIGVDQTVPRK